MTIKEITELRKSGHLAEAMAAAEIEFAQNANKYTACALFWCFNDLFKQQSGDEALTTVERMKTIFNDFGSGDDYMLKALNSAENLIIPHFNKL